MSNAPKPLGSLTPIESLLLKSRAVRIYAERSRAIVVQIAASPVRKRVAMSARSEWEEEVARALEEYACSNEAEAAELVRCLSAAEAQSYLVHKCRAIRLAAFEAVCAPESREALSASPAADAV